MRAACWSNKKTPRVNPKMLRLDGVSLLAVVLIGSWQITKAANPCDINKDGVVNVQDVQLEVNEAIGATPAKNDLNGDGVVNVSDVQIVVNAALGKGCASPPKNR